MCGPPDGERLTASGQMFSPGVNHPHHRAGRSEVANPVREIDPPARLRGSRGRRTPDGRLHSGSWIWRYNPTPATDSTEVRLTYDRSGAPAPALEVPPFGVEHLEISLRHLALLAAA